MNLIEKKQKISELIKTSYSNELDYDQKLELLESAHLISQPHAFLHLDVHVEMLKLSFSFKNWNEFRGQLPRIILAMPGSWLGKAPKGNIGSTKMGIFEERN